jgi:hypothetical protein
LVVVGELANRFNLRLNEDDDDDDDDDDDTLFLDG